MSATSAQTTVRLTVGDETVAACEGGFADPLPLALFPDDATTPDGDLRTSVATAAKRLARHGLDRALVTRVGTALARLGAAALADGDESVFEPPELAWCGPDIRARLALELRRTALGFEPRFPALHLPTVFDATKPTPARRVGLYALALAAHLSESAPDAPVVYGLGVLLDREDEPDTYLQTLRDAVEFADVAADALALAAELQARADMLGPPPAIDEVVAALEGLDADSSSHDLAALGQTLALSSRGELDPACRTAALEAAARVHGGELEHAIYRMLVWRAPERVGTWLDAYVAATDRRALDDALVAALEVGLPPGAWRASGVEVGARFIDAGHTRAGLRLVRLAADVDVTDPGAPPDRALVAALREQFGRRYGLEFSGVGELVDARFLLDAARHRGGDDLTHLARILCDALVGAAYEPLIGDDEEREAFFDLRIAPGLAYLEADPLPDGGTRRLRADRADESGPGMAVAVGFLLLLAALIAGAGYLIVAYA